MNEDMMETVLQCAYARDWITSIHAFQQTCKFTYEYTNTHYVIAFRDAHANIRIHTNRPHINYSNRQHILLTFVGVLGTVVFDFFFIVLINNQPEIRSLQLSTTERTRGGKIINTVSRYIEGQLEQPMKLHILGNIASCLQTLMRINLLLRSKCSYAAVQYEIDRHCVSQM